MRVEDGWAQSGSVRLHYLDSHPDGDPALIPLIFIPGRFGSAEDYVSLEISALAPRRCIAVSLRGRGHSDAPEEGYAFEDHIADVEAVLSHLRLTRFCLMGYSVGVPYVLGYAVRHPSALKGIILGDYPARLPTLPPDWAEQVAGRLPPERAKPHVARAIQRESREVVLWDDLPAIHCPVLILRGAQAGALLTEEMAGWYLQRLKEARVVVLEESGHELWKPEYIQALKDFLVSIDEASRA